jgi:hypothetical protein
MWQRELREWLGITLADLLVSLAAVAVAAMFFVSDPAADIALTATGVALALAACQLGMRPDPNVSGFTNAVKLVAYPLYVLLAVGAIVVHYAWFSK